MWQPLKFVLLAICVLCSGCSLAYKFSAPEVDVAVSNQLPLAKLPLTVGIPLHDEKEIKDFLWTNPKMASNTITLSAQTGKIFNKYSHKILSGLFDKIVILRNQNDSEGVDALISIEMTDINQHWDGNTSKFKATINTVVTNKKGMRIWDKTVQAPKYSRIYSFTYMPDETSLGKLVTESTIEALQAAAKEMRASHEIHTFADSKGAPQSQLIVTRLPSTQSVVQSPSTRTLADSDISIPHGKPAGKYDVAVVIGNVNYSATGTPNVDFALQDAQIMKEYLITAFGYDPANIIYIENASLAKMYELFGTDNNYRGKLYKWVKPGQSRIFIYYVGHGAPDQQTGEGYFVPVDANPQYISTSGYKLSTFYENLSKIPAAKKTVVIDACFSGSSANGQLIKGVSGLTARLKSEPKASVAADLLLTSAGMDQVASWYPEKGHSLFTYFFLKGIQGEADVNKDGKTTMGEMKIYLNEHVPYMARRLTGNEQQPVILGKDGDDLVVIIQ